MTQIKTCKEIHEEKPNAEWKLNREFFLHRQIGTRIRVQVERTALDHVTEGLDRDESYAEVGIYTADLDAKEFTKDFIEDFCYHLSMHEVEALIEGLTEYKDDWEKGRSRAMSKYVDLYGKY